MVLPLSFPAKDGPLGVVQILQQPHSTKESCVAVRVMFALGQEGGREQGKLLLCKPGVFH